MRITPYQLNMTASETLDIYRAMEVEIFKIVANRIKNNGSSSLLDWQLEKMSQLHLLNNEVLQVLSEYSGVATDEIREVITEAGYKCIDDVDSYMPDKLPKPHSNSIDMMMEGYVKQAFRDINNYVNQTLISTNYGTGSVMREYQQAMNKIAALHMSGIYTLDEAIYKTVVDWSKKGISSTFIDKGGHTWSMERYVDMVMRSTLQRTYNEVRTSRMAEYDVHTVLVSSHPKSRPACALCQGTVVDLRPTGKNTSGYRSVYEFGYGEPAGHRGINCTHLHFPFIPGVSENNQPQYDPDEAMANESIEQGRKKIAREIRSLKKQIIVSEALQSDNVDNLKQKLRHQQANMREYVTKYSLKRDYSLEKNHVPREVLKREGYKGILSPRVLAKLEDEYERNKTIVQSHNLPKTFDEYVDLKYGKRNQYRLLKDYTKSRKNNMVSAFSTFKDYIKYHNKVEEEIIGLTTSNGVKIKGQTKHFIERVLGTNEDPKTKLPRNGVEIEDIVKTLKYGNVEVFEKANYIRYTSDKCAVSINFENKNLIQVNPISKRKKKKWKK